MIYDPIIKEKIGIFINCHSSYGGAERRFYRVFSEMKSYENVYLIANKATINNLSKHDSDYRKIPNNRIVILPGGVNRVGVAYKLWHVINNILLIFYLIRRNIRHVHYPVDASFYSMIHSLILIRFGISYSLSIVDSSRVSRSDFSFFRYVIWGLSLKNATRVDYLSVGIQKTVTRLFPKVCKNSSVSPCSFTDYQKARFSRNKIYDLVMLSRFVQKKGHAYLVDGLRVLSFDKNLDRLKIGLFGDGPDIDHIKKSCQDINNFDFYFGQVDNVFEVLSQSRILLSLQRDENYPSQSVLEAYASGVICILTDVGESRKLVDEGVGFLVPNNNPEALALCIKSALLQAKSVDPLTQFTIARRFVESKHSIDNFKEYFLNFLSRCLR